MVGACDPLVGGAARLARQEVTQVIVAGGFVGILGRDEEHRQFRCQNLFDALHQFKIGLGWKLSRSGGMAVARKSWSGRGRLWGRLFYETANLLRGLLQRTTQARV